VLASCPAHKVNQITAEPRKNESASRHPALSRVSSNKQTAVEVTFYRQVVIHGATN